MLDIVSVIYALVVFVSLYGTLLFSWGAYKYAHSSNVYKYILFLFISIFIKSSTELYSRSLRVSGDIQEYYNFMDSGVWCLRNLLFLAVLIIICADMTKREFFEKKKKKGKGDDK